MKIHSVAGNHDSAVIQQGFDIWRQGIGEDTVFRQIVPAQICVDQPYGGTKPFQSCRKGLLDVAQKHHIFCGCTVWVRCDGTLKNTNLTLRHDLSHVVKSTASSQAKFKHRAGLPFCQFNRVVKARALRQHTIDKNIQTAHFPFTFIFGLVRMNHSTS
jgi:hypothetical protein